MTSKSIPSQIMTWSADFNRRQIFGPLGLTLLRALLSLTLPFFILKNDTRWHVIALSIFILAALTDYWDGKLARSRNLVSPLGKILDPTMDKFLVLIPLVCFALRGFYSLWWTVPIIARELIITFCRIGWMIEGHAAPAEKLGKIKFFCQILFLGLCIVKLLGLSAIGSLAIYAGILFINLLTVASGVSFLMSNKDHLVRPAFLKYVSAVGVGLLPVIPGTWGSAVGLMLFLLVSWSSGLTLIVFLLLLWVGKWAVDRLDLQQTKDPNFVVIDEVLGMFVTLFGQPLHPISFALGFLFFRVFDVTKPFPVRRLEKLPGFWGILCDDLGAGVYAWLALRLVLQLSHPV